MFQYIKDQLARIPWKKIPFMKIQRVLLFFIYMPLMVAYMEILLRLLTGNDVWMGLPFALLFSTSAGFLISLIVILIKNHKVVRFIASFLLGILSFIFTLQYFMFASYKTFMNFETIILEAGNVVSEFTGVFFSTLLFGMPVIFAFFLPLILFLLLTTYKRTPYKLYAIKNRLKCSCIIILMLALTMAGQVVIINASESDGAAFHLEYNFDSSSQRLGILAGVGLDFLHNVSGSPFEEAAFTPVEPLPPISAYVEPPTVNLPQVVNDDEPEEPDETPEPEEPPPPEPIEYGYNMIEIDFEELIANERNSRVRAVHEYVASLEASRQNEFTGLFEGKNLVIFTAEAFTKQVVDPIMTPTLYRLVHNGFYFSDFYQPGWGGGTSGGEFSILTGLPPTSSARSIQIATRQNICYTMGNRLMNLGYFSASYHNGSHTYYNRHQTHTRLGYSTFITMGNGMQGHVSGGWPASDLEMMEFSVPQYIDSRPFSVYYMTISGHARYSRGGNAMASKNWDAFPEQYSQMSNPVRAYMACNLELEYALDYLVSSLEEAGIADDTVIVLATDHFPYGLEKSEAWGNDKDYLSELLGVSVRTPADRDLSALIIWSGALENELSDYAVEISSPTSTLDILPTLLNLFGLEFDSRMFVGRDVFSDAMPLVFWLDRCWKTDAGFFRASRTDFTPAVEDMEIPEDYISNMRAIVNNRISYVGSVLSLDYFNTIYHTDGTLRSVEP